MDEKRHELLLNTALWWKGLKETNNDAFMPLFLDENRYLVLKGGAGSGKSIFAGRKVLERCTSEPRHRYLVCRKVARTIRDSCFAQLRGQITQFYQGSGAKINRGDLNIRFANGSEIIFTGLDDVEKLKSIYDITGIWIEEASELEEGDFNQLDIRLRTTFPYYLQIILSFNPIAITHWLKRRFFDVRDERARVHESTYKDNRFLPEESIRTLEGFKDTDPYYYMVYALGQWGVTGKTVFNGKAISARLQKLRSPVKQGFFEYDDDGLEISNIRWVEEQDGPVRVYREPEEGIPYLIGGDTAGEGSDWFVGQVLDNVTGEQVCTLRHRYDEDTYAKQMLCLGRYYNDAMLAVETNFSTYPVKILEKMGYQNQYVREVEDNFEGKNRSAFGFRTDGLTRPNIIAELIRVMRDHIDLVNDETTLLEMLTFVRNDKLRPEAEPGAHDDCVMALAIAYYTRPQQRTRPTLRQKEGAAKWSKDMWDDYNRATPKERAYLVEKWGTPQR